MILHLPFPPSVWKLYTGSGKFRRRSSEYATWRTIAGYAINQQSAGKSIAGPWSMEIAAYRPDKRRRDIDNLIKAVSDTLVSMNVVADDSEMQSVLAKWVDGKGEGIKVHIFQHNERRGFRYD